MQVKNGSLGIIREGLERLNTGCSVNLRAEELMVMGRSLLYEMFGNEKNRYKFSWGRITRVTKDWLTGVVIISKRNAPI